MGEPVTDERTAELAQRLGRVRSEIDAARRAAGRDDEVDLVVVTKFHPLDDVVRLADLGVADLGENRAQEAAAKHAGLRESQPDLAARTRWHMIGQIQSKKAGAIAGWADRVHSVDRVKVADGLDRGRERALEEDRVDSALDVLLQVSLDDDTSRGGVARGDALALAGHVAGLGSLRLRGLMVVPPLDMDPAEAFDRAAEVRDRLVAEYPGATEFSAGMSGDLRQAIAAGSTCVRVGTAILGERPIP